MSADEFPCPCCGNITLSEIGVYEICNIFGWEDDPVQSSDPQFSGGANVLSLNDAKRAWVERLNNK